jgi:uncharacterized protein (DUF4415 family)
MPRKQKEFVPGRGYTQEDWDEVGDPHQPTDEQFAQAKPFAEAFPELAASIKRARGKQKTPTKELISLRVDRATLAAYRASGPGWQARMNAVLKRGITSAK